MTEYQRLDAESIKKMLLFYTIFIMQLFISHSMIIYNSDKSEFIVSSTPPVILD